MIQVIVTHIQGIELVTPRTIAIDEEKIVDIRRRGIYTEISYSESYDRKWKPITYQITAALPNVQAAIQGDWTGKEHLSVTVEWGEPREMRPNIWETTYALDIQQKFIIDIEEVYYRFPWSTADELVTKLRYTSSAFLQVVVYVTEHLHDLVPDVPSATTTTTTEEPVTTTTPVPATTTTTPIPETTTTTTPCPDIYLSSYYYVSNPQNAIHFGDTLEDACDVMQQATAKEVNLLLTWATSCYIGEGNYYVTDNYGGLPLPEGYYIYMDQGGYSIYYVNEFGMSTLTNTDCPTTTTTPIPETTTTTTPIQ